MDHETSMTNREPRKARANFLREALLVISLCLGPCVSVSAQEASSGTRTGSPATLLPVEQAEGLRNILPLDRQIRWYVRAPGSSGPSGVLVFVKPDDRAEPQPGWEAVLDERNLIWVSAEAFGNDKPSAQRVLAALLGLALVQRDYSVDNERIYIGGMSGGGRIASKTITKFPHLFTGALYIVGVDFWTRAEEPLKEAIAAKRYVFLTGHNDFNRRETRLVYGKYKRAGVEQALLIDLPSFGHEYPDADALARALEFLDAR